MKCGIDFGTTNSSISILENGKVKLILIDISSLNPEIIRSMIYFAKRKEVFNPKMPPKRLAKNEFYPGEITYEGKQQYLIGQAAINYYLEDHKNRYRGVRRTFYTGRILRPPGIPPPDPVPEHYEEIDYGTGRLLQALKSTLKTNFKGTTIFGEFYTVEKMISIYLSEIKRLAEEQLGEKIDFVNAGRPVYFSEDKDIDTKAQSRLLEAYKLAGFKNVNFQFEPVAAAKQFISKENSKNSTILVFDFGGGTLDTAIVKMGETPEVLATNGVYIGGDLLNSDIMKHKLWDYFGANATWGDAKLFMPNHIYEALDSWYSIPSLNNPDTFIFFEQAMYKNSDPESLKRLTHLVRMNLGFEVYEAIERCKKELSSKEESFIIFKDGPIDLNVKLTRNEFEEIINERVEEIRKVVIRTLDKANLDPGQIDYVVRTGGSSLIPIFENTLVEIFGKEKITIFDTFTSIAAGLALD